MARPWSLGRLIAFRLLFAFFLLDGPRTILWVLPESWTLDEWYGRLLTPVTAWFAHAVFSLPASFQIVASNGSDAAVHWVELAWFALLSVLVAVAWTLADRNRSDHRRLAGVLLTYLRFIVAAALISYGIAKLMLVQMPSLRPTALLTPIGQAPPFGLLWVFMSASPLYQAFTGGVELLAGVLLVFKPTTLLGALLGLVSLTNVFLMNVGYDGNVKLWSLQLLTMSAIIMVPHLPRLYAALVPGSAPWAAGQRSATGPTLRGLPNWSFGLAFVLVFVGWNLLVAVSIKRQFGDWAPVPPQFGVYAVEAVQHGSQAVEAGAANRAWSHVVIDRGAGAAAAFIPISGYHPAGSALLFTIDTVRRTWLFSQGADTLQWTYTSLTPGRIVAKGPSLSALLENRGASLSDTTELALRRMDKSEFPIYAHRRWIQPQ